MNLTSDIAGNNQLRVFVGAESANEPATHLDSQLPFIQDLFQRFESVTGWTLAFHETRKSQAERRADPLATIFGEIEIDDMSSLLETGKSARHRGYCDQLVETLDCMVHIIQSDRQRFRNIDQHLSPVVDLPFDWWGIAGNAGYQHGSFSSWSVTSEEKVRIFAGHVLADDMQSNMLSSATLLSLFETASQTSIALEQIAPLVASVKERSSIFNAKLNWFTTVELDPVTGEFELDGYDCTSGVALIDTQAGALIELGPEELDGVLYSGQILVVGLTAQHAARLKELASAEESTVEQITADFQREYSQDAVLFLYRK